MNQSAFRPGVGLLILLTATSQIAAVIHTPSIPAMAKAFEADPLSIQLVMTLYLIGYAVAQLVVGSLSDAVGRRPVMLFGLALFVAASVACSFAPNIQILFGLRLLQAVGACTGLVVSRAIVRDCFEASQTTRYMGYLGMAIGLMPMLSPSVGGILQSLFGWQANFLAMGVVGFGALLATSYSLSETLPDAVRRPTVPLSLLRGFRELIVQPSFLAYSSCMAISTAIFFVYLSGGPLVIQGDYGVTPAVYGLVAMSMPSGFIFGNFISSRVSPIIGIERGAILGYLINLIGGGVLLMLANLPNFHLAYFILPSVVIGFGGGFVTSCGFAGVVQGDPSVAGTASGLSGFLQMAISALATVAVGLIGHVTLVSYTAFQLALTVLGIVMFVGLVQIDAIRKRRISA